jgi:predicted flap endonuclease-1-like 5' DNA nuclease
MLDRSTRTLLAVGFLLAAVLVTLWMIVRQRPIEDWWLPILLWLLGLLLAWFWQRGEKGATAGTETSPPAVAAAPTSRVRELVVSDAPAALPAPAAFVAKVDAVPEPAAFVAKVDTPPVVSEEAEAVEEIIAEEAASAVPEPAVAVSTVSMQEADVTETPAVNIATFAAPEAPPTPAVPDDLKLVEGIGPKMEKALHNAGILTFVQLASASEQQIRAAIEAAGMRFAPSIPTWAKQARYLADGDRDGLRAYQDSLTSGREA